MTWLRTRHPAPHAAFHRMRPSILRRTASLLLPFLALTVLLTGAGDVKAAERPRGREGDVLPSPHTALASAAGVTALTGQVKTTEGQPLANVALRDSGIGTRTNDQGEFLLEKLPPGETVLTIDGRHAGRDGKTDYGLFEVRVTIEAGKTTELPYVSYLPQIDHAHDVAITSPTTSEVVVKAAAVPGLELHIPPGAIITDTDGKPVTRIGITPIPLDRTPFPLPHNVEVPLYFTAQPGGATITGVDGNWLGVQVYYPNYRHELPKARGTFYKYEPFHHGWTPYGQGQVSADGSQMVPDQGTRLYDLTGAMYIGNPPPPPGGPCDTADPVDLASGHWVEATSDLSVQDLLPVNPQRTYNSGDFNSRSFGVGMTFAYDMYLYSAQEYQTAALSLPSCEQVHFTRIQNGDNGFADAVFVNTVSEVPAFYLSKMVYNSDGWNLTLQDGTVYVFGDVAPLQAIRDRYGNTVTLTHSNGQTGQITEVTSPNGRYINFTYDSNSRIIRAQDNSGRTVSYTYDSSSRIQTFTDADGGTTTYGWDSANRIATITDPRGNVIVTNLYDVNDRVIQQTAADGGSYNFTYTGGNIGTFGTETDITDPRGNVEKITFNSNGLPVADNRAVGTPQEQDTSALYDPVTNLLLSKTDALGRVTAYTYDSHGNVTAITQLAGTSSATTTQYTYNDLNQVTSTIDPLGHVTATEFDSLGTLLATTDALGSRTIYGYQTEPYLSLLSDPLGNKTTFVYTSGMLTSTTDPLGRVFKRYADSIGRLASLSDPLGNTVRIAYDPIYGEHQTTEPNGDAATTNYLPAGLVGSVVDARGGNISYTYDAKRRQTARIDPLGNIEQVTAYDSADNVLTTIDRRGQSATFTYDPLNRISTATYVNGETVSYTWDEGDRLTQIQDSASGTITRSYDGFDNLVSETTPQGTVTYTYDAASRRTSMSVPRQAEVIYNYDADNRLTQVIQGSATVLIAYDAAGRRTSLTLPNGIVATYSYDAASELTEIVYSNSTSTIGNFTYGYDLAGRQISRGGTLFQSVLPVAMTSASYDAANRMINRITASGGMTLAFDANGNLTGDGTHSYNWDPRDRLISIDEGTNITYDDLGRRVTTTLGGKLVTVLYDGNNPVQEQSGGAVLADLLTGPEIDDQRFSRTEDGESSVYLTDAVGSVVALAGQAGIVETNYGYDPYGNTTVTGAANDNSFQYTGRQNDGTGLYYYRARYYSPALERFISEDPIGIEGGINSYIYVGGNPISFTDPLGLQSTWPCPTGACPCPAGSCHLPPPGPPPSSGPTSLPYPLNQDSTSIPLPAKPRCGCTCTCRADVNDNIPGNKKPGQPTFAIASATASNCQKASIEAKRAATKALGAQPKHVGCRCAGK